jgi:hypothetical protein
MAKKPLDKYYTPVDIANRLIDKTFEIIGKENITEVIEPSAGAGAFSKQIENCIAYDIAPDDDSIIQADFLTLDISYKPGRLIIGNPPFGQSSLLAKKFLKISLSISDYVAFIMPISFLNSPEYDFINRQNAILYSEELEDIFEGPKCCFVIIKKCDWGINKIEPNKYNIYSLRDFKKKYESDFYICAWGTSVGKLSLTCDFTQVCALKFNNENIKEYVFKNYNISEFKKYLKCAAIPCTTVYTVSKYINKLVEDYEKSLLVLDDITVEDAREFLKKLGDVLDERP